MQQARRLAVAVVGFTVTLLGIVMLVTPGPGWLMILLGLGVLGVEFVGARRLLRRLKEGAAELAVRFSPMGKTHRRSNQSETSPKRKDNLRGVGFDSAELRAAIFRSQRTRPSSPQSTS
jgi:putative transmembrane protein PGPGW